MTHSLLPPRRRASTRLLASLWILGFLFAPTTGRASTHEASTIRVGSDAYRVDRPTSPPAYFEANLGQVDERVVALGRCSGYTAYFTQQALTLAIDGEERESVRMTFAGGRSVAGPVLERELAGRVNYLLGNDPDAWVRGVPTYEGVRYDALYDGVDAVFYGNEQLLEYDFVVAPGADPSQVRLRFENTTTPEVDESGDLVLRVAGGELRHSLRVYQQSASERRAVPARFLVGTNGEASVALGEYDRERALVIDPIVVYTRHTAGSHIDYLETAKIDGSGNVYLIGQTLSTNYPVTPGAFDPTLNDGVASGTPDGFVSKLAADGSSLVYSTYIGGAGQDGTTGGDVDATGALYLTGHTESTDFPTTPGAFDTTPPTEGLDAFALKLTPDGSSLVYSTFFGAASTSEFSGHLAVDSNGEACMTGTTESADFPTTPGAFDTSYSGVTDAYVTRISADGTSLVFSTYIGGVDSEIPGDIAITATGNVVYYGLTASSAYPVTPGAYDETLNGGSDLVVTKFALDGSSLIFSTRIGGESGDYARDCAIDPSGAFVLTGHTDSIDFPTTPGALDEELDDHDAFVTKLDPNGQSLVYSTYLGGQSLDFGYGVAVDEFGAAYVTGATQGAGFPITIGAYDDSGGVVYDAYLTKLDAGGALRYSTYLGGSHNESGHSVGIGPKRTLYVVGETSSPDFATQGFGVRAAEDAFVVKMRIPSGDTAGVYLPGTGAWFLRNDNSSGVADKVVGYGPAGLGWIAIAGDWDGDGDDTLGLYDPANGFFYLRNANEPGPADLVYGFGPAGVGWQPIAGDWDGDGDDTVGLYAPASGVFFLRDEHAAGPADRVYSFGPGGLGWQPVAGDWDNDGDSTVGLYDPAGGFFYLRYDHAPGPADALFGFGPAGLGWKPLAGDWDGDGDDTVGLYAPAEGYFFLRSDLEPGPADVEFSYGPANAVPVVGDWDGQ